MSASLSSSTTSTQQPGQTVGAGAHAATKPTGTVLVSGESRDSVNVQSQLATANVAEGNITSKSNIGQVIGDLGTAHNSSSAWLEAETAKVSQWGQGEIQRILQKTKAMEEALVLGAKEKQKTLDASHQGELAKLVQELDLRKAAQLKELEDGLQRQIQQTLSSSKADINRVESEMNAKKMDLLKQSQLKDAKQIDQLTNLVVETKLVPSQTRTVIETNTDTGNVVAVATGGHIATGSAQAESYSSQKIAAVPAAGVLGQASDVTRGDMIQDATGRKVGEGAIVNTQTRVAAGAQQPLVAGQQQQHTATVAHPHTGVAHTGVAHTGAAPIGVAHTGPTHTSTAPIAGAPIASGGLADAAISRKTDLHSKEADHQLHAVHKDNTALAHGHHAASSHDGAPGTEHKHGLLCKVQHALGMETKGDKIAKEQQLHGAGEPRSVDATRRI